MEKKKQFNLRLSPELIEKMENYFKETGREVNVSLLIREAIMEKIDPITRNKMIKREIVILKSQNDPDIVVLFPPNHHK